MQTSPTLPAGGIWLSDAVDPEAVVQPLVGTATGHPPALAETLGALSEVEGRYLSDHAGDTRTSITCLRKLYYDTLGWNTVLVPGTVQPKVPFKKRESDYPDDDPALADPWTLPWPKPTNEAEIRLWSPRRRLDACVAVSADGHEEEVPAGTMQEARLADGTTTDLGHVLAGLDARNHRAPIEGHAGWVLEDNLAAVTWLGDLASVLGELCFTALAYERAVTVDEINTCIEFGNPGVDMAGNIDAFLLDGDIAARVGGPAVTSLLGDYYATSAAEAL